MIIDIILVIALIGIDQLVKYLSVTQLRDNVIVVIDGVFELDYVTNKGAAWGIFQGERVFLVFFSGLLMLGMIYIYYKMPKTKRYFGLKICSLLIFSGAVGNFIDRVTSGSVVDMFSFVLIDFPVFNVADSYVVVGSIILIILTMFYYKDEEFDFVKIKRSNHDDV